MSKKLKILKGPFISLWCSIYIINGYQLVVTPFVDTVQQGIFACKAPKRLYCSSGSNTQQYYRYRLTYVDEVKHFNAESTVLGAIFMLGKTSGGNCFGNGTAKIRYSSQMLEKVTKFIPVTERRTVNVASWREVN